jgi:hypothetical protein
MAAVGLIDVMIGATARHSSSEESVNIGINALSAVLAHIAYGRVRLAPVTAG